MNRVAVLLARTLLVVQIHVKGKIQGGAERGQIVLVDATGPPGL